MTGETELEWRGATDKCTYIGLRKKKKLMVLVMMPTMPIELQLNSTCKFYHMQYAWNTAWTGLFPNSGEGYSMFHVQTISTHRYLSLLPFYLPIPCERYRPDGR